MKRVMLITSLVVAAVGIPAIAMQVHGDSHGMMPMMKPDMTRAQMEAMVKQKFTEADANKDGAVTMDEVKGRMDAKHTERMEAHFKAMDTDGNGSISRTEFVAGHNRPGHDSDMDGPDERADKGHGSMKKGMMGGHGMGMKFGERMFGMADANKDSRVTLAEATKAALTHFDAMDGDKNGTVTSGERMDFMKAKMKEWRTDK